MNELAIDGTAGDKLGGLEIDVLGRQVGGMGLDVTYGHQACQVMLGSDYMNSARSATNFQHWAQI